jgi:hypothetical protein
MRSVAGNWQPATPGRNTQTMPGGAARKLSRSVRTPFLREPGTRFHLSPKIRKVRFPIPDTVDALFLPGVTVYGGREEFLDLRWREGTRVFRSICPISSMPVRNLNFTVPVDGQRKMVVPPVIAMGVNGESTGGVRVGESPKHRTACGLRWRERERISYFTSAEFSGRHPLLLAAG